MKISVSSTRSTGSRLASAIGFELLAKYLRLSVDGAQNLPRRGEPAIFISNHSGFSGMDALLLRYLIYKGTKADPKILLHRLWYFSKASGDLAEKLGFVEASYKNGVKTLREGQNILLFPEGAHGNFKPYSKKYRLQDFKTGFLHMAAECQCPIYPILIAGPEESHINLKKISMTGRLRDAALPVPLNVVPLPAKWRVQFLKPILPSEVPGEKSDKEYFTIRARQVREHMQKSMTDCLQQRGHPFL